MKKTLLILATITLAICATAAAIYFLQRPETQDGEPIITFPGGQNLPPSSESESSNKIPVASWDGGTIFTNDFIDNGSTFEDPVNPGSYFVSGRVEYCTPEERCATEAPTDKYIIKYFSADQSFIIDLSSEPLGESRLLAEQYMQKILGITNEDMCALKYAVSTTYYVNEVYGSMNNLGFSFCPGAVGLP